MFEKRISIFTGHFGSGKTEVAVNYALNLSKINKNTVIVDCDIVNPFFRTADAKKALEEKGIKVILPVFANTNIDVPALSGEINIVFEDKSYSVVLDIGGDDLGARVVSRYQNEIVENDYEMFFVINTYRPMTDSKEKILTMLNDIEKTSRLKVSGLINNTNLLGETSTEDILLGHKLIQEVSQETGIKIAFVSGFTPMINEVNKKLNIEYLELNKSIKLPWQ